MLEKYDYVCLDKGTCVSDFTMLAKTINDDGTNIKFDAYLMYGSIPVQKGVTWKKRKFLASYKPIGEISEKAKEALEHKHEWKPESELRKKRVCFGNVSTKNFSEEEAQKIRKNLRETIAAASKNGGYHTFIVGLKSGFDYWAAEEILSLKKEDPNIKLIVARAFKDFDTKVPEDLKQSYENILNSTDCKTFIEEEYSAGVYQRLDDWIVSRCAIVISCGTDNSICNKGNDSGLHVCDIREKPATFIF